MWEERQELGSLVRRRGVTSPLALNHTYEQLSEADRAQLHAFFKKLGPGDEPPFPLYGIGPILRAMINEGTFGKIESGNVLVVVEVDAEGNGVSAKVSGASTPQVAREFAAKVALERFKPALCAGKPCPGAFPMVFAVGEP
jgi:hypothetical protein